MVLRMRKRVSAIPEHLDVIDGISTEKVNSDDIYTALFNVQY